jgi:N-acetylmuramoyl-L-alanine amidase
MHAAVIVAALTAASAQAPAQTQTAAAAGKLSVATCNRADFQLLIDVGHTAKSPGAISSRGVNEYEFNLGLATVIQGALIDAGFERTILLITEGPPRPGLVKRVDYANRSSVDLFLSIHHDSVPKVFLEKWEFDGRQRIYSDRFKGHSIFISQNNRQTEASAQFGRLLGLQLKARGLVYTPHYTESFMGNRRRILVDAEAGVYRFDQLVVLRNTHMPAVLLEAGSIINRDEELLMGTPEHQALIGAAVTDAADAFCASRQAVGTAIASKRAVSHVKSAR